MAHARTSSDVNTQVMLGIGANANIPPSPATATDSFPTLPNAAPTKHSWVRKLGPNELSYYLPSRADGVNDMYLHLQVLAPPELFTPTRVAHVWALLRIRHPLLGAHIDQKSLDEVYFTYELPSNASEAIDGAKEAASFVSGQTKDELVHAYLNGPRTLHSKLLSKILISTPPPPAEGAKPRSVFPNPASKGVVGDNNTDYDFMFFAGHFLGDGVSFAVIANEFLTLMASDMDEDTMADLLQSEIDVRAAAGANPIPVSTEQRLAIPRSWGKFQRAVGTVEFMNNQAKQIGGQSFPKKKSEQRVTTVDTRTYGPRETGVILKRCKEAGVTIAHAVFALCNIAWARRKNANNEMPMMLYSAINLRGALKPPRPTASSFFHLCVGYYNVVLPTFLVPSMPDAKLFWLRAMSTKAQTLKAVKSKFLIPRAVAMSEVRKRQAIGFAKMDDAEAAAKLAGSLKSVSITPPAPAPATETPLATPPATPTEKTTPAPAANGGLPKAPQAALMGVSFLGNLDAISNYTTYTNIHLSDLTFGARQRPGGMLMFAYTFAGRLWFSLGWDKNGYTENVVEEYWDEVMNCLEEFLLNPDAPVPHGTPAPRGSAAGPQSV